MPSPLLLGVVVVLIPLLLGALLTPPADYKHDHATRKIVLDTFELGAARYPPLVAGINGGLRLLPTPWLQWLLPLDLPSLLSAARRKVASEDGVDLADLAWFNASKVRGLAGLELLVLDLEDLSRADLPPSLYSIARSHGGGGNHADDDADAADDACAANAADDGREADSACAAASNAGTAAGADANDAIEANDADAAADAAAVRAADNETRQGGTTGLPRMNMLSPLGRFMAQQQLVAALATQAKLALFSRSTAFAGSARPESPSRPSPPSPSPSSPTPLPPIPSPIIIVGPPRTGTTFLHLALARHPDVAFLPYFEALDPVAPPSVAAGDIGVRGKDARVMRTDVAMWIIEWLRPLIGGMHTMGAEVPFEDMQLSGHCFSSMLFEASFGDIPRYSHWYREADQTFGYECIREMLAVIDRQRGRGDDGDAGERDGDGVGPGGGDEETYDGDGGGGGGGGGDGDGQPQQQQQHQPQQQRRRRWVLKTPQHTIQIKAIKEVFPDAVVVLTSRNPLHILRSLLPMTAYTLGVQSDAVDLKRYGRTWWGRLQELIQAQARDGLRLFPDAIVAPFDTRIDTRIGTVVAAAEGEAVKGFMGDVDVTMALLHRILTAAGCRTDEASMETVVRFVEGEFAGGGEGGDGGGGGGGGEKRKGRFRFAYELEETFGLREEDITVRTNIA